MLGAAMGGFLRYAATIYLPMPIPLVNILGSLIIGFAYAKLSVSHKDLLPLINTGFLGGLTTFSSFSLEIVQDIEQGLWIRAIIYALGSVAVGVLGCFLGFKLAG